MKEIIKDSYEQLEQNKKLKYLFLSLFGLVILSLLFIFRFYIWPFLTALILYMTIRHLHEKLQKKVKSRTISATIFVFAMLIVIRQTTFSTFTGITSILAVPLNIIINFFFMVLMLFFLLKDGYKLDKTVYDILPFPDDIEKMVVIRLKEVIKILLAGNLLMMVVQGLMVGIGFYLAGLNMPLLWGSVAAVFSLIPVIGTTFVWVPAALYLGISGEPFYAVFLSIWSFFWYIFLENLIKPKVFGNKLNFHPIIFFFLLLGSIKTLNLPGIIVGPILLTLYFSFWEIYKILRNQEKIEELKKQK